MLGGLLEDDWQGESPRELSLELKIGIVLLPLLTLGFLFRKGYSWGVRGFTIAWSLFWPSIFTLERNALIGLSDVPSEKLYHDINELDSVRNIGTVIDFDSRLSGQSATCI